MGDKCQDRIYWKKYAIFQVEFRMEEMRKYTIPRWKQFISVPTRRSGSFEIELDAWENMQQYNHEIKYVLWEDADDDFSKKVMTAIMENLGSDDKNLESELTVNASCLIQRMIF